MRCHGMCIRIRRLPPARGGACLVRVMPPFASWAGPAGAGGGQALGFDAPAVSLPEDCEHGFLRGT